VYQKFKSDKQICLYKIDDFNGMCRCKFSNKGPLKSDVSSVSPRKILGVGLRINVPLHTAIHFPNVSNSHKNKKGTDTLQGICLFDRRNVLNVHTQHGFRHVANPR